MGKGFPSNAEWSQKRMCRKAYRNCSMPFANRAARHPLLLQGLLCVLLGVYCLLVAPLRTIAAERDVSCVNDSMTVLTKAGCNVGVWQAKAGGGQRGFQLSLLGFEPLEDFDHLVNEGRGRRLFFG